MGNPAGAPASKLRFYAVMAVLLLVEVLASLEHTMIVSVLPSMVREFHDLRTVGWAVTAFLLAQAATAAVGGRLGDMIGRKRMLIIIVALSGLGSLISAIGGSLELIILGRAIQGVSGAILPLCYGITREEAAPSAAPLWIGILTGGYAFAAVFGYVLGGRFADQGTWRSVFILTAGFALVLLPLLAVVLRARPGAGLPRAFDWLGALLFAPAIAAVLYGVTETAKSGWRSGAILWLAGGAATLAIWAWHELRLKDPLINIRLLGKRDVAVGNFCGALASLGMMQLPFITLMILQQPVLAGVGLGVSATMAGVLKLPSNITALIASPLSGFLSGRAGARLAVTQGALVGVAGWSGMFFFHDAIWQVVLCSMVCGFGAQMLLAAVPNLVLEGVPVARSSEITGLTMVIRSTAAAIGAQTIAILLATSRIVDPQSGANFPSSSAYQLVFAFIAGTAVLIALTATLTRRSSSSQDLADRAKELGQA